MATRGTWKLRPRDDSATQNVSNTNVKKPTASKSIGTSLTKLIKSPFKKSRSFSKSSEKEQTTEAMNLEGKQATNHDIEGERDEVPPPPSLPPPLPPLVLSLQTQDKNSLLIVDAINSLQTTMIESHMSLERKLDSRLSSVEDQLQMLNVKFCDQDKAIRDLRSDMVDTNSLKQVEDSLCKVASQADQKFADLDQEIGAMRIELNAYRTENMRLSHRVFEAEEKLSLSAIRSKRFNFTLEGLPEAEDQNENTLTTLTDKINEGNKTKLTKDDFSTTYIEWASLTRK